MDPLDNDIKVPLEVTEQDLRPIGGESIMDEKEIASLQKQIERFIKCDVCGATLVETSFGIICPACAIKQLISPTLAQASKRLAALITSYSIYIEQGKKPKYEVEKIFSLVPACLKQIDVVEAYENIKAGTETRLSANQRKFIQNLFLAISMHNVATEKGA